MASMGTAHTHDPHRDADADGKDAVIIASTKRRKSHANQSRSSTFDNEGSPYKQRLSDSTRNGGGSSSSYHGLRSTASRDSDSAAHGGTSGGSSIAPPPPRPSYICTSHEDEATPSSSNTKHRRYNHHHRRVSSSGNSTLTSNTRTSRGSSSRNTTRSTENIEGSNGNNLFAVSTSPINHMENSVNNGVTPITKNTAASSSECPGIISERAGDNDIDSPRCEPVDFTLHRQRSREDSNSLDEMNESYFEDKLESHSSSAFEKPTNRSSSSDRSPLRHSRSNSGSSSIRHVPSIDGGADTPSLPDIMMNSDDQGSATDMMTDKHLLNRHLRGQSFTPLPHIGNGNGNGSQGGDGRSSKNASPTFNPQALSIASQLSWSIAGDTPALGDIADWDDDERPGDFPSGEKPSPQNAHSTSRRRSDSTHSGASTPSNRFSPFWPRDDDPSSGNKQNVHKKNGSPSNASIGGRGDREYDSILRLTALTPNSEVADMDTDADLDPLGGKTTPLPIFYDRPQDGSVGTHECNNAQEERENRHHGGSMERPQHHRGRSGSPRSRYCNDQGMYSNSSDRMNKGNSYYRSRPGGRDSGAGNASSGGPPPPSPRHPQHGDPEHIHHMFLTNGGRERPDGPKSMPSPHQSSSGGLQSDRGPQHSHHHGSPVGPRHHGLRSPGQYPHRSPMPVPSSSFDQRDPDFRRRDDMHGRAGERRDGPPADYYGSPGGNMFGSPHHHMGGPPNDRVRNLRGRGPPSHLAPPPLHIPHHMPSSHHHNLTSPLVGGGGMRWGGLGSPATPHHHAHHSHHGPHGHGPLHMHMDLPNSKRKCVPLKPPIPSKFQGDMEKVKNAQVPEFNSLVNFPAHISQKQSMNIPDGMRCCVMCGQACPCSVSNKNKGKGTGKSGGSGANGKGSNGTGGGLTPLGNNGQASSSAPPKGGANGAGNYAIIPTQNKGLCTLCDVNVWVVVSSGLEIKWCKGCKNFRPWAAFGDKGLATKCVRCRERQREKYALLKEEKEKARLSGKANGTSKVTTKSVTDD